MTDHANELRRYARNIAHPAGDVPSVMLAAADEIERLAARLEATEEDRARFLVEMGKLCAQCDALRAKITEMEKQEPARLVMAVAYRWRYRGAVMWQYGELTEETARLAKEHNHEVQPLYALPGAQNIPEKLCYDSRWEISIDYVDGWNAAVDMMRGKSPSWHCPDCCIAFPFGAPKSCPNDDARCNSLLAAAPETKP